MRIAVCHFSLTRLHYVCFQGQGLRSVCQGDIAIPHETEDPAGIAIARLHEACSSHGRHPLDALVIHAAYGGEVVDAPARMVDDLLIDQLGSIIHQAPLLIPFLRILLRRGLEELSGCPLVLCCDTGFFVQLPAPESTYAFDASGQVPARKYGFHGLYHHAAIWAAAGCKGHREARVISLCLADHPELTAIRGGRPLMVTGGISPVDGLPGARQCGDLDPGIPLILAQRHGMDASRIDRLLQRESGLVALYDAPKDATGLFRTLVGDQQLALRVFRHRLTLAAGAGIAAMGGLDVWVNSGPFAEAAEAIIRPVLDALPFRPPPIVMTMDTGMDDILAGHGLACLQAHQAASPPC